VISTLGRRVVAAIVVINLDAEQKSRIRIELIVRSDLNALQENCNCN
jgi:hypothetical protein